MGLSDCKPHTHPHTHTHNVFSPFFPLYHMAQERFIGKTKKKNWGGCLSVHVETTYAFTYSFNKCLPNDVMDTVMDKPGGASGPAKNTNVSPFITRVKKKIIWVVAIGGKSHAKLKLSKYLRAPEGNSTS